ncbi:alanine--tRNA ligase-related protein [Frondihabitans australicus]|uniref:alanine--tRNA ligase n=1 Tax=Frondihabitans australicus TaxID=386892 RepID=A0A495ILN8_9MICO|nr:alanine--tRNA ligase-related protein [Frondihabitans australicus]RKR76348.1 alanyl-tRNA synthetase [Frondihabitans australicus]
MNVDDIRRAYLQFMLERGHVRIRPASLVPDDTTTLFTSSGMQSLLSFLLGRPHPDGTRLTDVQPCLRAQDIDDVGDNRHTTFFEMLGNWSLGAYFKEQQIRQFFNFLTDIIGLDPARLYVTCFQGDKEQGIARDDEAASIWQKVFEEAGVEARIAVIGSQQDGDRRGILPGERIFFYDADQNWWSRGGSLPGTPSGDPCGPDSEVFFDFGPQHHDGRFGLAHPASDGGRFLEIGNQVFMQYRREADGSFVPLERRDVDFGAGLERIAAAVRDDPDIYRIDVLAPLIRTVEAIASTSYDSDPTTMRIIVDHVRGAVFLAADGVVPSNKQQGYVMRRLLRRAIAAARRLDVTDHFFSRLTDEVIRNYADTYPQLAARRESITHLLDMEEKAFRHTLDSGYRELQRHTGTTLSGQDIFHLSDTFGFPRDVTLEEARRLGSAIDAEWDSDFANALEAQRRQSRQHSPLGAGSTPDTK